YAGTGNEHQHGANGDVECGPAALRWEAEFHDYGVADLASRDDSHRCAHSARSASQLNRGSPRVGAGKLHPHVVVRGLSRIPDRLRAAVGTNVGASHQTP